MSDKSLTALDEAFARSRSTRLASPVADAPPVAEPPEDGDEQTVSEIPRVPLTWVQLFFAVQFLWGALLFVPGAQAYRGVVRALPYVSAVALLGWYLLRASPIPRPKGTGLLIAALLLLALNLIHPTSQLYAGLAQCVFQLSIAAPMFWIYKTVRSPRQLEQVLVLVLMMNFAGAGLGLLQVYYPDTFMPPQFSQGLADDWVESMAYVGSDGRRIVRPPGLTDTPGGAAIAGGLTALMGLGLSLRAKKTPYALATMAMSAVGLAVIYLTQARSVMLMTLAAAAVLVVVVVRQGKFARASWLVATAGALVVASFLWAASVGGSSVEERFLSIGAEGALTTYRENRGLFLAYTTGELLDKFPLGAGVGRWGMMNTYFGDLSEFRSPPIYVEIQLTGWLLDGGIPMWILYGGAIVLSLIAAFRIASVPEAQASELALVVLTVQVFIAGMTMAGPTFNMQLGVLFWALASALQGGAFWASGGSDVDRYE